jgi:hypothetical protein
LKSEFSPKFQTRSSCSTIWSNKEYPTLVIFCPNYCPPRQSPF